MTVLEVTIDPSRKRAVISGIATKPERRKQGVATASLNWLLNSQNDICKHVAYVALDNLAARRCLERLKSTLVADEPNEDGYLRFERMAAPAAPR